MTQYVGLDAYKQTCHVTVVNECGEVLKEGRFPNKREDFEEFFESIDDVEVAIEASYCWQPECFQIINRICPMTEQLTLPIFLNYVYILFCVPYH